MPTILDQIIATKKHEVAAARKRLPLDDLKTQLEGAPPTRDFFQAVSLPGRISLIAEVKKASPSAGVIREDFSVADIGPAYERGGAACLSVLTDESYFMGHLQYLSEIRHHVSIPVLRKDFIIDAYQLWEARRQAPTPCC